MRNQQHQILNISAALDAEWLELTAYQVNKRFTFGIRCREKMVQHGTGELTVSDNNLDGGTVLFIFVIGIFVGMTIAATAAYFGVFSACGG